MCKKQKVQDYSKLKKIFFLFASILVFATFIEGTITWIILRRNNYNADIIKNNISHLIIPLALIIIYLFIVGIFILRLINKLSKTDSEKEKQVQILSEYTKIISIAGYGIWHILLKDGEKPKMQVNDKMAELLAISSKKLTPEEIYSSWYDNILPEEVPSVLASVEEMKNGFFSENTYQWNHPEKGVIYVRCGGTSEKLSDGTTVLRGYHSDVTELVSKEQKYKDDLKLARQKAEVANAAKTSFLFNMSHDIRTPMNAIIGYTDLLEKYHSDPEKFNDYLSKIRTSSDFLLSLINNVLEMARIDSGKTTLDENSYEPGIITKEIYSIYSDLMNKKNINFTHTVNVKTPYIFGDVVKLKEIFLNIISNAFKYTPSGGSITITTEELDYNVEGYTLMRTVFSDTGIGMSKEFLPYIFEEFSRERNATEAGIKGTGLGMPIVKKLVDLMNGTIEVESELGKGTKFTLTLPVKIADSPNYYEKKDDSFSNVSFIGKRLLLAEDNDLNAEIAIEILSNLGFEVEWAKDGIICVDMLQRATPYYYDLILMDVQMPNMDGYKATRIIRRLPTPDKRDIPIIAMTANAFESDKKNAYDSGMNGHVSKPINVSELIQTIGTVLK